VDEAVVILQAHHSRKKLPGRVLLVLLPLRQGKTGAKPKRPFKEFNSRFEDF
jgi:hypothetical protein